MEYLGCKLLFVPFASSDPKRKEKTGFSFRFEEFLFIPVLSPSSDLLRKGSKIRQKMKEFLETRPTATTATTANTANTATTATTATRSLVGTLGLGKL